MEDHTAEASPQVYARIAGFTYLLIIVIGVLNASVVDPELIVSGNDAATATNILANDLLFRLGIATTLIMYASVVVLSWALYVLLKTVNKNLALLGMLLRSGEAILGAASVLVSFLALVVLNELGHSSGFETKHLQALAGLLLNVRTPGLDIVLLFVGLGGTPFFYLFYTSRYIPRTLATWGILTYVSMAVLSLLSILLPDHPVIIETLLYGLGAAFEVVIGCWLLIKGVTIQ